MTRRVPLTRVRVGDKVRVAQDKCGVVIEVESWANAVSPLTEPEAVEFTQLAMARFGPDCRKDWQRALVQFGNTLSWVENDQIRIVERHEQ